MADVDPRRVQVGEGMEPGVQGLEVEVSGYGQVRKKAKSHGLELEIHDVGDEDALV